MKNYWDLTREQRAEVNADPVVRAVLAAVTATMDVWSNTRDEAAERMFGKEEPK